MVTVPITVGQQQRAAVNPVVDLRQAFPDLGNLAADNGLYGIWIGVGAAPGRSARTLVTAMEVTRTLDGPSALALQHSMMSDLRMLYPAVALGAGLEASYSTHLNWFSPTASALSFQRPQPGDTVRSYLSRVVSNCHAAGGVASYNHPFGASIGTPLSGAARTNRISSVAKALLANRLYGCDVLEVGYQLRGSMDLRGHVDLWDVLLAAGTHVMANGVSDDHAGTVASWTGKGNQYMTDVISASRDPAQVTPLLKSGRAYVSLLTGFNGLLDLSCGSTLMGGTHSDSGSDANVTVTADALPSNGKLRVLQYRIHGDVTRLTAPTPLTERVFTPSGVTSGKVSLAVPNVTSYLLLSATLGGADRVMVKTCAGCRWGWSCATPWCTPTGVFLET
ncbi:MAG: hypothetical protein ACOYBY_18145, partial [Dermatophilaceae bacterium]